MDSGILILGIVIGILAGSIVTWLVAALSHHREKKRIRSDATNRSRHVLKGKMAEQMAPLLQGFRYNPADARFMGDPIDYLIVDGYSSVKDGVGRADDIEIILLDIKTGTAQLSKSQKAIRDAVKAGRVRFETLRVSETGEIAYS